jgi:hypothetical protein
MVENCLGRPRCVPVHASRDKHDEHAVAPETALLMTPTSFVNPGTTLIRSSNASSFPTLCFPQTPTTW